MQRDAGGMYTQELHITEVVGNTVLRCALKLKL